MFRGAAEVETVARAPHPVDANADEELERAHWYALLAGLLRSAPDSARLASIAAAGGADRSTELGAALGALADACAGASVQSVRDEFDATFVGVGKPEVFVNASYYLTGFLHERPLADLRDELARLGIARRAEVSDTEDHFCALCDVMRMLIADRAPLARQRALFDRFVASWVDDFCDALERAGTTDFYKHVGRVARAFFAVERTAFDFDR